MVTDLGWDALMPPLQAAGATLGTIKPELAAAIGLRADCRIICGIHDSNASLLRHLGGEARTVLSTGTWTIAAALGDAGQALDEQQDMLANVNAFGQPVPCIRFMGGREFEVLAGPDAVPCSEADLAHIVARMTLAVPCFSGMGGPFARQTGRIVGPAPQSPAERYALATLYCALMTDYCLGQLAPDNPVVVEGAFSANPHFPRVLGALRPGRAVTVSDDASGTTIGGWMLATGQRPPTGAAAALPPMALPGLEHYASHWRAISTPLPQP